METKKKRFVFKGNGVKVGALGRASKFKHEVIAKSYEEAIDELYKVYEHIQGLNCNEYELKTEFISKTDLIKMRDNMPIEELREINRKTMEREGHVDYNGIFETMGYVRSFNDYYKKKEE